MQVRGNQIGRGRRGGGAWTRLAMCAIVLALSTTAGTVYAQGDESVAALKAKADELVKQQKYVESLPVLEKLVAATPNDADAHFNLGFAYLAQAEVTSDAAAQKAIRVKARQSFLRAKELHVGQPVVDAMIQAIPEDGSASTAVYSQNPIANALMNEAERFFAQSKWDEALQDYQKALKEDPNLYEAALYSGDVYTQRGDFAQAETSYQRAISINPNREIAYRYSATPLMKQGKTDEAKLRYVEAYVVEPHSKFAAAGLTQWAQAMHIQIGHPRVDIPVTIGSDAQGEITVNTNSSLKAIIEDGSLSWITYGNVRKRWRSETFAKTFPKETVYRHSLAEEADALRSVLTALANEKAVTAPTPALKKLKQINDAGLLEAFILMAKADEGISKDFPDYLKQHRDLLRRYVIEFVLTAGGD
jgi:tetratricopeptide (TPR) repeat protein